MIGITSYAAYIPWYRISKAKMAETTGFLTKSSPPGERSVANLNEDSVTMATNSASYCIEGLDRNKIDGLYFATTSQSYLVRQHASIVSTALDLREDIRAADFTTSSKAGTSALLNALDAVKAGSLNNVLVSAADCRKVEPANPQEFTYGDGAAAFLVGKDDVIATLEGSYSLSVDFMDRWHTVVEKFERASEDRWIRDEGYEKLVPAAINGLLSKLNLTMKDISKLVFCYPGRHAALAKKLGADPAQVQDNLIDKVGDTGAAYPLMMLVGALEEAKPGDKILVASFGQGADVLLFKVTDNITRMKNKRGIKESLARKKDLDSWAKFASIRDVVAFYQGPPKTPLFTSHSMLWRERKELAALCGFKCKKCGTVQYPPRRTCVNPDCKAIDQMENYRLSDKKGKIFTYTVDHNIDNAMPPSIDGFIDFDGGGRIRMTITDVDPADLKVGMPVEMTYRRKHVEETRGIIVYYWCATPARS